MLSNEIKSKIKQLNIKLIIWSWEYYQKNKPSVTDLVYDAHLNELKELVEAYNFKPFHCMLDKVGKPSGYAYATALEFKT